MKKVIAAAILALIPGSGWTQGTVDFRNGGITFPTDADRRVYGRNGPLTGTTFVAGLWYLPGADRGGQMGSATQVGRTFAFRPDTTSLKGYWVQPAGVSPIFTFPDVAVGNAATLQVRVWDFAKFNSWEAAVAGGQYGDSAPFNYIVPAAGSTPDKYYMDNLRAFYSPALPEPSAIVLGLLCGAAGWLFLRRR